MTGPNIFTVGGTVQANEGGLYLSRRADGELLALCREATFAYVLTPRQMGKSSLMVRTAEQLVEEGVKSAIVDLTQIGAQVTADEWYRGVLTSIADQLMLNTQVKPWWEEYDHLSKTQRLTRFFERVILTEFQDPVVVFVDEIDTTLSLDFTDDFYAAIRSLYVARATNPELRRLSFVLIGVATPGDLIRDPKRTPFNIGQRVELTDFTAEEALPLAMGLGISSDKTEVVLQQVLQWTGGHPYLTQRLCRTLAEQAEFNMTETEVDRAVQDTFLGKMSEQDNNLQFVRDMLTKRSPQNLKKEVLETYRQIRRSRKVVLDDEQSLIKSHLTLSGVVCRKNDSLRVRNAIYREVFNQQWIQRHLPENYYQRLKPAMPLIAALFFFSMSMGIWAFYANQHTKLVQNEQIIATNSNSEILMRSGFQLEALIEGIRVGKNLKTLNKDEFPMTYAQVTTTLQQTLSKMTEKNRLEGNSGRVRGLSFSSDGKTLATGSDAKIQLWSRGGKLIKTFDGFSDSIDSINFSPDSKTLATGSNNVVQLWSDDGKLLKTLMGHGAGAIRSVSFSPDGKTLASASGDMTVKLWTRDGKLLKTLGGFNAVVVSVSFSPDGKILATGSYDMVKLWTRDGKLLKTLTVPDGHRIWSLSFSPDGKILATGGDDKKLRLWTRDGKLLKTLDGHTGRIWSVSFSPDNKTLATGSEDKTVKLWNREGQILKTLEGHRGRVWSVSFSPDGKTLATGGGDETVKLWDNEGQILKTFKDQGDNLKSVSFSLDSKTLATIDVDTVKLWDKEGQLIKTFDHYAGIPSFSPHNNTLAASNYNILKLWSRDGKLLETLVEQNTAINSMSFSSDGRILAIASDDNIVRLWNLNKQLSKILEVRSGEVISMSFSPDGNTLAMVNADNTVKLWSREGKLLKKLENSSSGVWKMSFLTPYSAILKYSPDGKTFVMASDGNIVKLWSSEGQLIKILEGYNGAVGSVSFSPDGNFLATGSAKNTVKLWSRKGELIKTLEGHSGEIRSVSFSPDGNILATGSADNTVKLWSHEGQLINTLEGHSAAVVSVSFSPDGKTLAKGSIDGTVELWSFDLDSLLSQSCHWLSDYLKNNPKGQENRSLCQNIRPSSPSNSLW